MTSSAFLKNRLSRLQRQLKELEAYVVEEPIELFYFTQIELSLGRLLVTKKEALLIVDGRYFQECREKSPFPVAKAEETPLFPFLQAHGIKTLGLDEAKTTLAAFAEFEKKGKENGVAIRAIASPVRAVRVLKEEREIALMQRSAEENWSAYLALKGMLKEGMSELEAVSKLRHLVYCENGFSFAFDPIIAFGENSAKPHHHSGERRLKKGDLVLIDMGLCVDHYHSDMTRVFFFGTPLPQLKQLLEIAQKAQRAALAECYPGVSFGKLDQAARAVMAESGVEELFCHSLGHGIGLETHEYPRLSSKAPEKELPLEEGMVITIEPGLYIPEIGGVRYEDTVVITKEGYRNFYKEES